MNEGYPDRIISKSEIKYFEFLLKRQALDYPNYEKWVSNTIKQRAHIKTINTISVNVVKGI